ncbi:NADPH-dependent FMN reductase [Salinibacillus xinjiangensis]|uniref:NAD(P)H-dependent oxidoreductase n=1 Tax=Salinibacillus xinjiangensis TaxID=1229268 RepID=A0A6G1X591_9BACI|nr:NAD(P)H-dependent oxidoreductase [Salinibacillus xinjiangensis]MRG86075.1 NAD(P)H-dependent oxidoreductase [Salinibacillus xinjiangensis]
MKILGISGSLSKPSKTYIAVENALQFAEEQFSEVKEGLKQKLDTDRFDQASLDQEVISLHDYHLQFCDGRNPFDYEGDTKELIDKIIEADALIIGSPVYRGSMSGALKNVFDLIPNDCLKGKVIGFVATGGTYHHFLAIEHQLHPLAGYFSAHVVPGGVYAHNEHYDEKGIASAEILERLRVLSYSVIDLHYRLHDRHAIAKEPHIPRKSLTSR